MFLLEFSKAFFVACLQETPGEAVFLVLLLRCLVVVKLKSQTVVPTTTY